MTTTNIIVSSVENVSTINNQLTLRFPRNYRSQGDQIGLVNLSMYNSFFNLTSAFNNLVVSYTMNDGSQNLINFPPGFYTVDDLSGYIQYTMNANGHYLVDNNGSPVYYFTMQVNPTYYTVTSTFTPVPSTLPAGYSNPNNLLLNGRTLQLQILNNNWGALIGYANNTLIPLTPQLSITEINSTQTPQINPVTNINVTCTWINDTRFSRFSSVIATFVPNAVFGGLMSISPPVLSLYPVTSNSYSEITIAFMDQNNNALQIQDRNQIQIRLVLKSQ